MARYEYSVQQLPRGLVYVGMSVRQRHYSGKRAVQAVLETSFRALKKSQLYKAV